jgi:hypothetical protein
LLFRDVDYLFRIWECLLSTGVFLRAADRIVRFDQYSIHFPTQGVIVFNFQSKDCCALPECSQLDKGFTHQEESLLFVPQ